MNPDDEHFFIVTAIKDSNLASIREVFHAAPEIIVIKVLGRR